MRIANAPVSWGIIEFEGMETRPVTWETVLDEMADAGYEGTELGDWGFLPTDPARLAEALASRNLAMLAAYVPVRLVDPDAIAPGLEALVRTARLLAAVATEASKPGPFIVLADENGTDPVRTRNAGRVRREMMLDEDTRARFARAADSLARRLFDETGVSLVFHHHSAGFVETPEEIDRFLDLTDPGFVSIVFDTGHYTYGTGGSGAPAHEAIARYGDRIRHVHFKDCSDDVAARIRAEELDYFSALHHGLFCELGEGAVDFPAVVSALERAGFDGWIVVEQDVLPGMGTPLESALRNRAYLRGIGL
jgi:inosose dehydratase